MESRLMFLLIVCLGLGLIFSKSGSSIVSSLVSKIQGTSSNGTDAFQKATGGTILPSGPTVSGGASVASGSSSSPNSIKSGTLSG